MPFSRVIKVNNSGNVDRAALGFLLAAAVAMLAVVSKALPGLFSTLVVNFLRALAEIFPNFFQKST